MLTNKQKLVICIILLFIFDLSVSTELQQKLILDDFSINSIYYILLIIYDSWWA